jgi:copper transport protein
VISLATWILWVHILAVAVWLGGAAAVLVAILPEADDARGAAQRAHFLTSRAMEILILTGVLNIVMKGVESGLAFSTGFFAMLSVKMALLAVMAGLQIWMGRAWGRAGDVATDATRRARIGLSLQCLLGAVAALLGLGLRAA